jgi:hypothetical protein
LVIDHSLSSSATGIDAPPWQNDAVTIKSGVEARPTKARHPDERPLHDLATPYPDLHARLI